MGSVICCYLLYKYKIKRNTNAVKKHVIDSAYIISTMRHLTVVRDSNELNTMQGTREDKPLEVMIEDLDYIMIEGLKNENRDPSMESMERMNSQSTNKSTGRVFLEKTEPFCKNTTSKIKFKRQRIDN